MRKIRKMTGDIVPDPYIVDQVRDIVYRHWDRATCSEYDDFVEVHMHETPLSVIAQKEKTVEDLEAEGFEVEPHRGRRKVNVRIPEGSEQ